MLTESAEEAGRLLAMNKLVAFPTETVFGLGANALNEDAVESIFVAKGRPSDNPLIVHLADRAQWESVAAELTESASLLLDAFSPGPITVVLPKRSDISDRVTAGLKSVGIRIPGCPIARAVLSAAGIPIAAPSANLSGRPSCTTWQAVVEDMRGRVDAILCKTSAEVGLESTVVDCRTDIPVVLRAGGVGLEAIRSVIPEARMVEQTDANLQLASPGTRHPHYQPVAPLTILKFPANASWPGVLRDEKHELRDEHVSAKLAYCGITRLAANDLIYFESVFESVEEYSRGFYEFLREADRRGASRILCESVPMEGIGIALNDRMSRSADRS